jgi:hypothetical protein
MAIDIENKNVKAIIQDKDHEFTERVIKLKRIKTVQPK